MSRTLLYGEEAPELSADALGTAQLPLGLGGLGLRSATFGASAAYWLPDAFPPLLQRFPADAAQLQAGHNVPHAGMPPALAVACTTRDVREAGLPVPKWSVAAALAPPHGHGHLRGWQRAAVAACDERALETHPSHLNPASRALLLSQGRALTVLPTSAAVTLPPEHLRVLLLRRLRLPLPLTPRTCRCRGRLDPLGDHRSACATSGVLASRVLPLARVCRESSARVARNVRLADMNIDVPVSDARCIEVVAVLSRGTGSRSRRLRRQTYPELKSARRARLVVIGVEVGGRFGAEAAAFLRLPPLFRAAACAGWVQHWSGLLAVVAMHAFAASRGPTRPSAGRKPPASALNRPQF